MIITKKFLLTTIFIMKLIEYGSLCADNDLVLQLKHAPLEVRQAAQQAYEKEITQTNDNKTPSSNTTQNISQTTIQSFLKPSLSGFSFIYGGYVSSSSHHGLVTFPLRGPDSNNIYVAITANIEVKKFNGNTIENCCFKEKAKYYLFTKKVDQAKKSDTDSKVDPATQPPSTVKTEDKDVVYWEITEVPANIGDVIARNTIIILTNINNIVVDLKSDLATKTVQCILPFAFLVVGDIDKEECSLRALDYKAFFEQIKTEKKFDTTKGTKQVLIKTL